MPGETGKKIIVLYILQILQRYTDADHPMTQQQIAAIAQHFQLKGEFLSAVELHSGNINHT